MYPDIGPDIGTYPISGIPYIGYVLMSGIPISGHTRYRVSAISYPISGSISEYTDIGTSCPDIGFWQGSRCRHQKVTRALAHDRSSSVNYSMALRPKCRGFKFEKKSRKGCDRFENRDKTSGLWSQCSGKHGHIKESSVLLTFLPSTDLLGTNFSCSIKEVG